MYCNKFKTLVKSIDTYKEPYRVKNRLTEVNEQSAQDDGDGKNSITVLAQIIVTKKRLFFFINCLQYEAVNDEREQISYILTWRKERVNKIKSHIINSFSPANAST